MKAKKIIIALLLVALVLSLASCLLREQVMVKIYVNGQLFDAFLIAEGDSLGRIVPPELPGYIFSHWEVNGKIFDTDTPLEHSISVYAVYEIDEPDTFAVTFIDRENKYTVITDNGACVKAPDVEWQWHIFKGWYTEQGEKYDFTLSVKGDFTLVAKWNEDVEAYVNYVCELYSAAFNVFAYTQENMAEAIELFEGGLKSIKGALSLAQADEFYASALSGLKQIPSLPDMIEEAMESLGKDNYFEEQWKEILTIFDLAKEYIQNYKQGVPTPEAYTLNAIEKAREVLTKEQDIKLAQSYKNSYIRRIENYAAYVCSDATEAQIKAVEEIVSGASARIEKAVGTAELARAFAGIIAEIDVALRTAY